VYYVSFTLSSIWIGAWFASYSVSTIIDEIQFVYYLKIFLHLDFTAGEKSCNTMYIGL
jgi:hypothetical protein